jgi:hypothetical protein
MDASHTFELRARDLRRVVGARLHLTHWDVGVEAGNEWFSTSTDSPERRASLVHWLESKKVDASSEFIRFDSFSNALQRFGWREILEQPQAVFVGDRWKMVSSDLRWVFDFMSGSVRFGALKGAEPVARANDPAWHVGCGAAFGAKQGRGSSVTLGKASCLNSLFQ